jgi:hypothetical protein
MPVDDNIELGYTRIVEEPEGENRVAVYITVGMFFGLGLLIGGVLLVNYLFAKKIWL